MLKPVVSSAISGSDIVIDPWANILNEPGLVEIVGLDVNLVLGLRHIINVGSWDAGEGFGKVLLV
jgi:hypothetical protein